MGPQMPRGKVCVGECLQTSAGRLDCTTDKQHKCGKKELDLPSEQHEQHSKHREITHRLQDEVSQAKMVSAVQR